MRKFYGVLVFFLLMVLSVESVHAFGMSISPAQITREVRRGDRIEFSITFGNNSRTGDYVALIKDYVYGADGRYNYLEGDDVVDSSKLLDSWIEVNSPFVAEEGRKKPVKFVMSVPEDADFGDHYAVISFEKYADPDAAVVGVAGAINALLSVKVLGGSQRIDGELLDYDIVTQQRAKNTANINVQYSNTGSAFYFVLAEVLVYQDESKKTLVKQYAKKVQVFPNVKHNIRFAVGDLGDDYGEREYYTDMKVYLLEDKKKAKILASAEKPFFYYVPITAQAAEPQVIQKEVVVTPPIVDIVKELGIYIGAFILLLLVFIRVLFFSRDK